MKKFLLACLFLVSTLPAFCQSTTNTFLSPFATAGYISWKNTNFVPSTNITIQYYAVDTTTTNVVVTLPPAVNSRKVNFNIKLALGTNSVVVTNANGIDLIDGGLSKSITNQYSTLKLKSDGTNFLTF